MEACLFGSGATQLADVVVSYAWPSSLSSSRERSMKGACGHGQDTMGGSGGPSGGGGGGGS
jgi:hypothetical protein